MVEKFQIEKPKTIYSDGERAILDHFGNKIIIHGVQDAYPDLSDVEGIEEYVTRSLVLPGKVIYVADTQQKEVEILLKYYTSLGIGPYTHGGEVRFVHLGDTTSFTEAALADMRSRGETETEAISLFGQSRVTQQALVTEAGHLHGDAHPKAMYEAKHSLGLATIRSADVEKGFANDKGLMRAILEDIGATHIAVPYMRYSDSSPLEKRRSENKIIEMAQKYRGLYVKTVNGASGEGIKECTGDAIAKCVLSFIEDESQKNPDTQFVIEQSLKDIAIYNDGSMKERSAQYIINDDGSIHYLGMTLQNIKHNVHQGNSMSTVPTDAINNLQPQEIQDMNMLVEYLSKKFNYRGYLSIDLVDTKEGLKALEVNARITGATGPMAVLSQLQIQNPERGWGIISKNTIQPDTSLNITSLESLGETVANQIYTTERGRGIIPTLVTTLPEKLGVIAVGYDEADAKLVLADFEDAMTIRESK